MKWWHWLVLEMLIIFGVIAWIYFFPSEFEYDLGKGMIAFALIYVIEECKDIKQEEIKMKKIKGYNIVKEKTNELLVSIEIGNDEVIERDGYKVIPFYEEGNPTIEQNAGENRIEGGVVSISGSVSEKKLRPFKDCEELIEHYQRKYKSAVGRDIYFPSLYKPCIWIRDKTEDAKGDIELITGFTEHGNVLVNGTSYPLQHLFQMYEFLDGTPCGVEE
jgi:hypothetical protein